MPQQVASSQPGVPFSTQQSPWPGQAPGQVPGVHSAAAKSAQLWSQTVLQQVGSDAQTVVQQAASSQLGVPLAEQQSPSPGQGPAAHSSAATLAQS